MKRKTLLFIKSILRRGRRIMLYVFGSLLVSIFILIGVLLILSPGKAEPFLDENGKNLNGSISEKVFVNINGMKQGMFIRGKDKTKPVLLFLHGGPGMPENAIARKHPDVLEEYFVVCWWEMRGSGISYNSKISEDTMTFDQLISDTIEITNYLRKRFGQEKIYLMAHSGGSFTGIQVAAQSPELYYAYIAMSQISNQLESEKLAYKYMIDEYTRLGDKKMLKDFSKYSLEELNTPSYYIMRDKPMHELGIGTTRNMKSVISGVFMPVMLHKEYTLSEKINIWRGKSFNTKTCNLWGKLVETDLTEKVQKLEIPVYFIHGKYDYTVSYTLAMDYFNEMQAPIKGFYTFDQSAHSPLFEEPERMKLIIQEDILELKTNNADKVTI